MIDRIVELRESGLTFAAIAAQLGMTKDSVQKLYRRHHSVEEITKTSYKVPGRIEATVPKGWEQGFEIIGGRGSISSGPVAEGEAPDWDFVMRELKLDPDLYEVIEPINVRSWDALKREGTGKDSHTVVVRLWYYKANVVQRRQRGDKLDIDALKAEIRDHIPYDITPASGDRGFVVNDSDWQLGKRDGDGTKGVVERVMASNDAILDRIHELRASGRKLRSLWLNTLGDLVEGCDGHYAQQTFGVELDRRGQVTVARHLVKERIKVLAPHFEEVVVSTAPGNHGENRRDGKSFTSMGDNDDVAVIEQVADVFEGREHYNHVRFVIPDDQLSLTFDIEGTRTTIAHGHQARSGTSPSQRAENWWKDQAFGFQPAIDSTLLITAHYHHLSVKQQGDRTHVQVPALESVSDWYRETRGIKTKPGVLTLVVGGGEWSDLQVL